MGYELKWSHLSRADLRGIVRFISRDSPQRAQSFALRLIAHVEMLQQYPESGRVVPELRSPEIRETVFKPYRIVYRHKAAEKKVEIVRVWHAARGTPKIPGT